MVPFRETITSQVDLINEVRKGYRAFSAHQITKNDFLMYFGFTHGEAIINFYGKNASNQQKLLTAGGFHTGSSAYFSAGINAWENLKNGIYKFPPISGSGSPITKTLNLPLQQIFYGAPGTGKSHKVNKITKGDNTVVRTTFHPDSDYASFVGCYKPIEKECVPLMQVVTDFATRQAISIPVLDSAGNPVDDKSITYKFTQQAFLKAYIRAWMKMNDVKKFGVPTLVSISGGPTSPYSRTGKVGSKSDFEYNMSVSAGVAAVNLTNDEKQRLLEVDNFDFPFEGIDNFGELHDESDTDKVNVVVTDLPTDEQKGRYIKTITFTAEQIRDLYKRYKKLIGKNGLVVEVLLAILNKIADKLGVRVDDLKDYSGDDVTITVGGEEYDPKLLGLYDPSTKTVYLFKGNIGEDNHSLLCSVYIHEMFHAYYHSCGQYVPEIEEPVVECNTLCFLELFGSSFPTQCFYDVKRKKHSLSIGYYGFGSYLFENRSLDWMKLYDAGWKNIVKGSGIAERYVNKYYPVYPFGDEADTMDLLYNILNPQVEQRQTPDPTPQYLIIEEINRGNCAQVFGDIFQLLDRCDAGFSQYPIVADDDLRRELKDAFKDLDLGNVKAYIDSIFAENYPDGITDKIKSGELLVLPCNLYIWATMNTSDQSLFPMDSAFKRRWEWEYVPIRYSKKEARDANDKFHEFKIEIGSEQYLWVDFLKKVNEKILALTDSEDKQMGEYFIKKDVDEKTFINKVMYYLWSEVGKDLYNSTQPFFVLPDGTKDSDGKDKKEFSFNELFRDNATALLKGFMKNLEVESLKSAESPKEEETMATSEE